jgi:hypothetical protein
MTDDGLLEQRIADHYEREAPYRAPGWVLDAALEAVDATRQRHGRLGLPKRTRPMDRNLVLLVAAIALIVLIGAIGLVGQAIPWLL